MTSIKTTGLAATLLMSSAVLAADHADGPGASLDKTADLADLYSWISPDKHTTYFAMDLGKDVQPGTKFSNTVKYVFHTSSMPAYGATGAAVKKVDIVCTFDAGTPQKASCWIGGNPTKDFISGNPSATGSSALTSKSGKIKLFAGLRNDPFFFNLAGFQGVAAQVHAAAGSLSFNSDGCPALGATGQALATGLTTTDGMSSSAPGTDTFAPFNTLAIVLAVDTTLVTAGGPIVSVWASTNN